MEMTGRDHLSLPQSYRSQPRKNRKEQKKSVRERLKLIQSFSPQKTEKLTGGRAGRKSEGGRTNSQNSGYAAEKS